MVKKSSLYNSSFSCNSPSPFATILSDKSFLLLSLDLFYLTTAKRQVCDQRQMATDPAGNASVVTQAQLGQLISQG